MPPPKIQELDGEEGVVDLTTSLGKLDTLEESRQKRQDRAKPVIEQRDDAPRSPTTANEILPILKERPNTGQLLLVLKFLAEGIHGRHEFNIRASNTKAAQIINVLVNTIIPDYWSTFSSASTSSTEFQTKQLLLKSLCSVAGIGAFVATLKRMGGSTNDEHQVLLAKDTLACLAQLLAPEALIHIILNDITKSDNEAQCHVLWREFVNMVAGGKLLSTTSEVVFVTRCLDPDRDEDAWVADGREYTSWIGKNLRSALLNIDPDNKKHWSMMAQMVKRCITLAHPDLFVAQIVDGLILREHKMCNSLQLLFDQLQRPERGRFFKLILNHVLRRHLSPNSLLEQKSSDRLRVGGVAAMIADLGRFEVKTRPEESLETCLINWICSNDGDLSSYGIEARRSIVAALADKPESLHKILEKSLKAFSDKLYIQHTPIIQQEALSQVILLTAGYLCRQDTESARRDLRSSYYFQAVSNRLAASLPRARVLGMMVGMAISRLLETPEKNMKFDVEELDTTEAKATMDLIYCEDKVGSIQDLKQQQPLSSTVLPRKRKMETRRPKSKPAPPAQSRIVAIEELSDSDEAEDLEPYQKPDEDPEDSEDDPTLINRSKPTAPVYIKDLITGLQSSDSPETTDMALKTAPSLIRRKANFGTELSENLDRLASALINLKEGLDKPENRTHQLQAMIACLVAQPSKMAPWFIAMYFEGDLSQAQRATVVTAVGLSAREIGGHTDVLSEETLMARLHDFPSQRLPSKLASAYETPDPRPTAGILGHMANRIEQSTLRPMALEAADQISGPNALKIRTFSSRMEVDRRREAKQSERSTRIPKDLHRLLAENFFMELCGRLGLILSHSHHLLTTIHLDPPLLRLSLQTLLIILNTLGPHALQLPLMTRETLLFLTTLHTHPTLSLDPLILPPTLSLLLQLIDLNVAAGTTAEERLVTDFGALVAELVEWVRGLDERVVPVAADGGGVGNRGGDDGDENENELGEMPWTVMAAGVQVRWAEVGRKFQGRMLGLGLGMGEQGFG